MPFVPLLYECVFECSYFEEEDFVLFISLFVFLLYSFELLPAVVQLLFYLLG